MKSTVKHTAYLEKFRSTNYLAKVRQQELCKCRGFKIFFKVQNVHTSKDIASQVILCKAQNKILGIVSQKPRNTLKAARNSVKNVNDAVQLSEGICFCGGLEPSTSTHFKFYYHFDSNVSMYVGISAFKIYSSTFIWTSTKSRHKLWFRTCLVCRKPR